MALKFQITEVRRYHGSSISRFDPTFGPLGTDMVSLAQHTMNGCAE
jgi:hypothetical protein